MSSNIMPGRLRDTIEILEKSQDSGDWGVPDQPTLVTTLRANVNVRSGDQLVKYGTEVTSEVITALTYYRESVTEGQQLKWLNGRGKNKVYEIKHVKPADNRFKSMIITAEIQKHVGNSQYTN